MSGWVPRSPLPGRAGIADPRPVIAETDQALAVLLKTKVIGNAAIAIVFDPPNRPWIQALKGPAINLFLFDIRENVHRRDVMYEKVRNADGAVVARRPPPPRFDLHYIVTAWAPSVLAEHKVLAAALRLFSSMASLPRDVLPAPLAALPYEVMVETGAGAKRSMFVTMGGDLKAGFDLTLTVPIPGLADQPAAPVVKEQTTITVHPPAGATASGQPANT